MPITKSAKKRARQEKIRNARNKAISLKAKKHLKNLLEFIVKKIKKNLKNFLKFVKNC